MPNRPPKNICLLCGYPINFNFNFDGWSWWARYPDKVKVGMVHDACVQKPPPPPPTVVQMQERFYLNIGMGQDGKILFTTRY